MAETEEKATEVAAPKKKGKLPLILALVVLLGGGGFFMKMKGGPPVKEEITLGTIEPLEEFLVDLNNRQVYLRVEIALHLKKGFEKKSFDENLMPIRDAIILRLRSKNPSELSSTGGLVRLKHQIAADINRSLEKLVHKDEKAKDSKDKDAKDKDDKPKEREHPDWDSDEGPVLKVYFKSFATQS